MADKDVPVQNDKDSNRKGYGTTEAVVGLGSGAVAAHLVGAQLSKGQIEKFTLDLLEAGKKVADEKTVAEATASIMNKITSLSNPLKRPFVAFSNASTPMKIGMGAAVAVTALGTAWAVNAVRNMGKKSHVEQLEAQKNGNEGHSRS